MTTHEQRLLDMLRASKDPAEAARVAAEAIVKYLERMDAAAW